ncbi:MAG: molecular chaperone GroEL [Lachnospiraceae bacterium]
MSYIDPKIKDKFETLSVDLKNAILARNVQIYTLQDLVNVLDAIVKEAEG